jgi:hypothetical protein
MDRGYVAIRMKHCMMITPSYDANEPNLNFYHAFRRRGRDGLRTPEVYN